MPPKRSSRPSVIELNDGTEIPILFENRSVLAIDKPEGWMLVPFNWQKTNRNLHAAIVASIASGQFWARSRGLKYLCHVHRLDADTTGILLCAKSRGAVDTIGKLFETRSVTKRYLAVVHGVPAQKEWSCHLALSPDPSQFGRIKVDGKSGKEAETQFTLLATRNNQSLIEARPITGRTHQIRVHLASAQLPIVGDILYGRRSRARFRIPPRDEVRGAAGAASSGQPSTPIPKSRAAAPSPEPPLALRAFDLSYRDPFTKSLVAIHAPYEDFVRQYGFDPTVVITASGPSDTPSEADRRSSPHHRCTSGDPSRSRSGHP